MRNTFKAVPVGQTFKFAPSRDGFHVDPHEYRKVSARCYVRLSDDMRCTVGTVHAEVLGPVLERSHMVEVGAHE